MFCTKSLKFYEPKIWNPLPVNIIIVFEEHATELEEHFHVTGLVVWIPLGPTFHMEPKNLMRKLLKRYASDICMYIL